jgi:uncharacterized membrane protein
MKVPRLLPALALVAALAGLGISVYLTVEHYAKAALVCNLSGFSCAQVLTSVYATLPFGHLPTSAAGLLFFSVAALLLAFRLLRPSNLASRLSLAWAATGLLAALYFIYLEIVVIAAICLWCTAVHVLVAASFLLLVYQRSAYERP